MSGNNKIMYATQPKGFNDFKAGIKYVFDVSDTSNLDSMLPSVRGEKDKPKQYLVPKRNINTFQQVKEKNIALLLYTGSNFDDIAKKES